MECNRVSLLPVTLSSCFAGGAASPTCKVNATLPEPVIVGGSKLANVLEGRPLTLNSPSQ